MGKRIWSSLLMSLLAGMNAIAGDNLTMIVGTYTEDSSAKGIYAYDFNQKTGESSLLGNVRADNPSFLAISDDCKRMYAVKEYQDGRQCMGAFSLDITNGNMSLIGYQKCGKGAWRSDNKMPGGAPCNVMLYDNHVVTSNYFGGDISVFPINADGSIAPESQYFDMHIAGSDVVSHIHCCHMTPDNKYMLANDLGNDCIWRFTVGKGDCFLSDSVIAYQAPRGTGPRHLIFNKKGDRAYLIGELDGTVTVLSYSDGNLQELQRVKASRTQAKGSADIHLSPDGRYLYASHRLEDDGVSIFAVDKQSGLLTKVGYQQTAAHPRNFAITPNGRFLLVASRDNNVIEVYRRNKKTGLLTNIHHDIHLGKPVCIQFCKKTPT